MFLAVLLLDLQSKTRTQDPLGDRWTGELEVELHLSQVKSANIKETHSRQSEERNANQRERCCQQTAVPGDGKLVSVTDGRQGDLVEGDNNQSDRSFWGKTRCLN